MTVHINKFPSIRERQRVATLSKFQKLYDNEQMAVLGLHDWVKNQFASSSDVIYLSHAIPSKISDFYGDFVQGDVEQMTIESVSDDEKEREFIETVVDRNDIKEKIIDYATDQSQFGFFVLLPRIEDDEVIIEFIAQDQYFPQPDGSVVFATYKKDPHNDNMFILFTQHYQLENGNVKIERQGFKADKDGVATEELDITTLEVLMGKKAGSIKQIEILTELDELPVVQVDNGRRNKDGFGRSDYSGIIPQLAEVNERASHISTELLKNLNAKLVLPHSKELIDEDGNVKKNWDTLITDEGGSKTRAEYIINQNPLIKDARESIQYNLQMISTVTGVPMFELLTGSAIERVESLRIKLFSAIRKTTTKRAKIAKGLRDVLRIAGKMSGTEVEADVTIRFGDVLPSDDRDVAEVEEIKIRSGLTSKLSAIKRVEGYDDERAEEELDKIAEEDQIAGLDTDNPPTVG